MTEDTATPGFDNAQYAGFWVRFFAACIDLIVYTPVYYGILFIMGGNNRWWAEGVFFIFGLITYALFFASKIQASPGMYVMKFHVCDTHGKKLSFRQAVMWGIVGALGWILCCAGTIYMQSHFDIFAVRDLLQSCKEQNVTPEDCIVEIESITHISFSDFQHLLFASIALFTFLSIIWALSIGLAKDKTGFNNMICHTRFIKGRMK